MLILAFETSAKAASVALLDGNKLLGESYQNTGMTHSQTLMVMAEDLLKTAGKTAREVTAVAVAEGPGSFTGIRIGMAAVKGFALAQDKPCAGISTLEAGAWGYEGEGKLCVTLRARGEEVFWALFEKKAGAVTRLGEEAVGMLPDLQAAHTDCIDIVDDDLIVDGLRLIYERYQRTGQ